MKRQCVVLLICCVYNAFGSFDDNGEIIGNPDDLAEIVRPCPTFDLNCIRKFFVTHGDCRMTFGPTPDPVRRAQVNYYLPRINVSTSDVSQQMTGLNNARVEEFYINKNTDNLVMAVDFRNVNISVNNTNFIFHRRAREAVVTSTSSSLVYQSFIITAIIPKIDDLQIEKAECTAFVNDDSPVNTIGPSAGESSDPQVQRSLAEYFTNQQVNIQEYFLTDAYNFIVVYIQYNICDFGLLSGFV